MFVSLRGKALYKACSAFTRVTACTLARSPICDTHPEGFSCFVTSTAAPVASGGSIVRQLLMVSAQLAGIDIERHHRVGVEIVPGGLAGHNPGPDARSPRW
jgi:hypothetical protein